MNRIIRKSINLTFAIGFAGVFMLTSCIRDEALNAEADILYCILKNQSILQLPADTLVAVGNNTNINIKVISHDLAQLAPEFVLTEGATISPESGTVRDFSNGALEYVVTSQDGKWHKSYWLRFDVSGLVTKYSFENYKLEPNNGKYYVWYEESSDGDNDCWASGNAGFGLSRYSALPDEYPTIPYAQGYSGSCLKLVTRSTGSFGEMANRRLAAGNMFLGTFDVTFALTNTLACTSFGIPFAQKPRSLYGYYQYTAGDVFWDEKGNEIDSVDEFNIYAVFFKNTDKDGNAVVLHGNDVLTNENIVATAEIDNSDETTGWSCFDIPFIYRKEVNATLLESYGYSITIVFSASKGGDTYTGAVGSTLLVDEVELICEGNE